MQLMFSLNPVPYSNISTTCTFIIMHLLSQLQLLHKNIAPTTAENCWLLTNFRTIQISLQFSKGIDDLPNVSSIRNKPILFENRSQPKRKLCFVKIVIAINYHRCTLSIKNLTPFSVNWKPLIKTSCSGIA